MKISVSDSSPALGGGDFWPPGFRFHPTDEELVLYYLKRKICRKRLKLDIVGEIDVYKWDPEQLPGQSKLKSGDKQWFFFSPRDRKYPNGARSNRATRNGYWKTTGKDRFITYNSRTVGIKKTLVFYRGRAPTGKRTDWVMHEYILDEEELKRCQTAKDCYVLYKLYKKSGPGPKNGEQYGAPFKEEDWGDEECVNITNDHVTIDSFVKQVEDVHSVDNNRFDNRVQSPLNDLEKFMNQIDDEPSHFQPFDVDCARAPHQVVGDEEIQNTLVDSYLAEPNFSERSIVIHPNSQLCDVQQPEVTSAPNICGQQSHVAEEDFLADFLEMDDLIVPEPALQNTQNPLESLQLEEIDGLCEFDLYHDAAMFLREMVPVDQGSVSDQFLNNFENEIVNPAVSHSYPNNLNNGMINPVSHLDMSNLENGLVNPVSHSLSNNLNNDMVNHSNDANGISIPLWTNDQRSRVFTQAEPYWCTTHPISGVGHADNSANLTSGVNQNQNQNQSQNRDQDQSGKEDIGIESWFSSALWDFVDSIPTTPASASENALVNRAFERMSSFSRLKVSTLKTNDSPGNPTATMRRRSGILNRGLLCFSVLGLVCAILWVLMGTSVNVLGRFISS